MFFFFLHFFVFHIFSYLRLGQFNAQGNANFHYGPYQPNTILCFGTTSTGTLRIKNMEVYKLWYQCTIIGLCTGRDQHIDGARLYPFWDTHWPTAGINCDANQNSIVFSSPNAPSVIGEGYSSEWDYVCFNFNTEVCFLDSPSSGTSTMYYAGTFTWNAEPPTSSFVHASQSVNKPSLGVTFKCLPGYTFSTTSASSTDTCSICSAGYRCPGGQTLKVSCGNDGSNRYSTGGAVTSCSVCGTGKYVASGHTGCYDCNSGFYCPGDGYEYTCPEGSVSSSQESSSSCEECAAGTYSDGSDPSGGSRAAPCLVCPNGTSSLAGMDECPCCSPGNYGDPAHNNCTVCADGLISSDGCSKKECQTCGAGLYANVDHTACLSCNPGFYCNGDGIQRICPEGTVSETTAASSCHTCGVGLYANVDHTACLSCNPGFYCNGDGIQRTCPEGTVSAAMATTTCQTCEAGTYSNASDPSSGSRASPCLPCPDGTTSFAGMDECCCFPGDYHVDPVGCTECEQGKISDGCMPQCETCPDGLVEENHIICKSCNAGYYCVGGFEFQCGAGKVSGMNATECYCCPAGTEAKNRETCEPCSDGEVSESCSVCTLCADGTYTEDNRVCLGCPPGSYCSSGEKNPCSTGWVSGYNKSECDPCGLGTYVNASVSVSECLDCEAGSYCINGVMHDCLPGQVSDVKEWACTDCVPGEKAPLDRSKSTCDSCPPGTISSVTRATECHACGDGEVAVNGNTECVCCQPGHYANETTFQCEECPYHHISEVCSLECSPCEQYEIIDDDSCVCCPAGQYALNCALGSFSLECTSDECEACPEGTYVNSIGSGCKGCPAGSYCTGGIKTECEEYEYCPPSVNSSVDCGCSFHGSCSEYGPGICFCFEEYTGDVCDQFECFGWISTDDKACTDKEYGTCVAHDTCVCFDGHYEEDCSEWRCGDFEKDDKDVCSGHGKCIRGNQCECKKGYFSDSPTDCDISENDINDKKRNTIIGISVGIPTFLFLLICVVLFGIFIYWFVIIQIRKTRNKRDKVDEVLEMEASRALTTLNIDMKNFTIEFDEIVIEKTLGSGGSKSRVMLGRYQGASIAFKVFMISDFQADLSEFNREVEIMGNLSQFGYFFFFPFNNLLVPIFFGFTEQMEFCENGELGRYVFEHKDFPLCQRLRIILEVALAMEFVHSKKYMHRDLKCENVLLSKELFARLIDFGLSRTESRHESKTFQVGTSFYMAPELVKGVEYDNKIDSFSFAVMIYITLTGKKDPFPEYDRAAGNIEFKIANDPMFRPDMSLLDLPEDKVWIKTLIVKNWDEDPKLRDSMSVFVTIFEGNGVVAGKVEKLGDDATGKEEQSEGKPKKGVNKESDLGKKEADSPK